jgi:hypothetical protein
MANTLRDIALTVGAGSLIVLTTMFGMKQCSDDKQCCVKDAVKTDCKTPKVEVINNNAGGKSHSRVVVTDDNIYVENNNEIASKDNCDCKKCGKDTLVVEIVNKKKINKTVNKQKVENTVKDTTKTVVSDTLKQAQALKCSIVGFEVYTRVH